MRIRHCFGLAVLPLFFAFCPLASAVSYSWNFTGGTSNTFTTPGGPTVTVTAWYVNGNGKLQSATLGHYSSGLGVCDPTEQCTNANQQLDNNGDDEFLLFTFSKPIDPTSITIKSPTSGGLGVSYWLGSTANQSLNLTNMNMTTSLSTLGFGSQQNSNAGAGTTRTIDFWRRSHDIGQRYSFPGRCTATAGAVSM